MVIKIKTSNYPEEWYCAYHKCCNYGTEFMCGTPEYCPGCGQRVEEVIRCDYEEMRGTDVEADRDNYNNDAWCNTCEYKYLETECLGCAKYDEYDNLIALSNYKKEVKE